jgi:hypothetical protein
MRTMYLSGATSIHFSKPWTRHDSNFPTAEDQVQALAPAQYVTVLSPVD